MAVREVPAVEVSTGRVLCMPDVTDQERTVICAKTVGPAEIPDPTRTADEPYSEIRVTAGRVRLGVYPAMGGIVEYFEFNTSDTIRIDDPRGGGE